MTVKMPTAPRQTKPELEHAYSRSPELGYEPPETAGFIRCLSHGFPTPLARWHYHDEYELHLITASSGKVFVGDWIGQFQPGQLVLTGPRLPHNWITMDMPEGGVPQRDLVIQFTHEPLTRAAETIPELREVLPLLERAKHGIEFFGMSEAAERHWHRVKNARGLRRLTAFCDYLADLAACTDYRLLSSVQLQSDDDDTSIDQIHDVVSRITDHLADDHSASALAAELGMSESRFSRFFRKATGNTFTDFVNRARVEKAKRLLMKPAARITEVAYEVGFQCLSHFNRSFRRIASESPTEYRGRMKQGRAAELAA